MIVYPYLEEFNKIYSDEFELIISVEAKAVQSQYSGVLEGWLEDAPDDDHHDEHTLDLKHHDVS